MAVDRQGTLRSILRSPAYLWLQDISASGKVLLGDTQDGRRHPSFRCRAPQGAIDQLVDVASESSEVDGISADGITAFSDL